MIVPPTISIISCALCFLCWLGGGGKINTTGQIFGFFFSFADRLTTIAKRPKKSLIVL